MRVTRKMQASELTLHGAIARELQTLNASYARLHAMVIQLDDTESEQGLQRTVREVRSLLDMATKGEC